MDYIKAEATSLFIGDIEFDAIRIIETKEYRVSLVQLLQPLDLPHNWFNTVCKKGTKAAKALQSMGFTQYVFPVEYSKNGVGTRAKALSLDDATIFIEYQAFEKSNPSALKVARTLMRDSLQDRWEQVWDQRRTVSQRRADDNCILDCPEPWSPMFEQKFEANLERITGLHKCHIRNSQFYWEFIYRWLTTEERIKLDEINPIGENGRRRHKIHTCIEQSTKDRLRGHIQAIYILMESANSVTELRRMVQRRDGFDQGDLFDGWAA